MVAAPLRKEVYPDESAARRATRGQALVVILLIMAVVLTIGLAVVSRSVTDIRLSRQEEESTRAFSAAEAGIEAALLGEGSGTQTVGQATYTLTVEDYASGVSEFVFPDTAAGETVTIWFVGHDTSDDPVLDCSDSKCFPGSEVKFCWGRTESGTNPAIELTFVYERAGAYEVARTGFDPDGRVPNFDPPGQTDQILGGVRFAYCRTVDFSDPFISGFDPASTRLLFGQAKLLFNNQSHRIGVGGEGNLLPAQGRTITSLGQSGEASRRIEVFRGFAEPPPIFSYSLYSGSDLSK